MSGNPIDGNAMMLAAAKASVGPRRLPALADRFQRHLVDRLAEYRRRYEAVHEDAAAVVFFVEDGHWAALGESFGLDRREWRAVERAHTEHLRQVGTELDRREEFETSLDIREVVVIGLA